MGKEGEMVISHRYAIWFFCFIFKYTQCISVMYIIFIPSLSLSPAWSVYVFTLLLHGKKKD